MQLRLTATRKTDETVIRIDGRLGRDNIAEVEDVCNRHDERVVLDLTDLLRVDDAGIGTLRRLRSQGIVLVNPSPYVALLLAAARADRDREEP